MILISSTQTSRSWVVIFHLRQPMAFLSISIYDTSGLAPHMNVLFWGPGEFPVSYANRDTLWNASNRHTRSFMVNTEILFSNMKSPSHVCYMTFWASISYNDFQTNQTFCHFHDLDTELDLDRITSGVHGTFATGVTCKQGTLTLGSVIFWDLLMLQFLRPVYLNLSCLFSTFHL